MITTIPTIITINAINWMIRANKKQKLSTS